MNKRLANSICLIGIVAFGAWLAWIYPSVPDPMPTHWNAAGQVDGYSSKQVGMAIVAGMPVFSLLLFKLIPVISPRGFRTESFSGVVNILMTATVIFSGVIGVGIIRAARDPGIDMPAFVLIAVGLLFMVIGSFLGKVRKNFFLGIRTPWTLASDEVWARTHRLGGWCFVIAGLLMVILAAAAPASGMGWVIGLVVAITLIPVVYSYFAYRKIEGFAPDPGADRDR